jgi:hypothetical protein
VKNARDHKQLHGLLFLDFILFVVFISFYILLGDSLPYHATISPSAAVKSVEIDAIDLKKLGIANPRDTRRKKSIITLLF